MQCCQPKLVKKKSFSSDKFRAIYAKHKFSVAYTLCLFNRLYWRDIQLTLNPGSTNLNFFIGSSCRFSLLSSNSFPFCPSLFCWSKIKLYFLQTCFDFNLNVSLLFQAYAITLGLAMVPGLFERGLIQKYFAQLTLKLAELYKGKEVHLKKSE